MPFHPKDRTRPGAGIPGSFNGLGDKNIKPRAQPKRSDAKRKLSPAEILYPNDRPAAPRGQYSLPHTDTAAKPVPGVMREKLSPAEILYPNDRPARQRAKSAAPRRATISTDVRGRPPRPEIAARAAPGAAKPGGAKRKLSPAEILYPNDTGRRGPAPAQPAAPRSSDKQGGGRKLSPAEILYPNDTGPGGSKSAPIGVFGNDKLPGGAGNDTLQEGAKKRKPPAGTPAAISDRETDMPGDDSVARQVGEKSKQQALRSGIYERFGLKGDPNLNPREREIHQQKRMAAAIEKFREKYPGQGVDGRVKQILAEDGKGKMDAPFLARYRADHSEDSELIDDELVGKLHAEYRENVGGDITREQFETAIGYTPKSIEAQETDGYYRRNPNFYKRAGKHIRYGWLRIEQGWDTNQLVTALGDLDYFRRFDEGEEVGDLINEFQNPQDSRDLRLYSRSESRDETRERVEKRVESEIHAIVDIEAELLSIERNPAAERALKAETVGKALTHVLSDLPGVLEQIFFEGLPEMGFKAAAGLVAGPAGVMAASTMLSFGVYIIDVMKEQEVDVGDRRAVRNFLGDSDRRKDVVDEAIGKAVTSGLLSVVTKAGTNKVVKSGIQFLGREK